MGKRCDTCDFLYLSSCPEMHSGTICAEYRALKRKYRLSSTDYHRILNQMIDGGLLLDSNDSKSGSKAESESGESSATTHSEPKRRKKRKREEVTTNSNQSEDDIDSPKKDKSRVAMSKNSPNYNSLYHRCPIKSCAFKTLKGSDDPDNTGDIKQHLRTNHFNAYIVFCQTKFPPTTIQCKACKFWFRDRADLRRHHDEGMFSKLKFTCFINKVGGSSRWSFCPNSAGRSIEMTTIGYTHPALLFLWVNFCNLHKTKVIVKHWLII